MAAAPASTVLTGKLLLQIIKAENLVGVDLGGKSDPYVKVLIGDPPVTVQTPVIDANLNPTWNARFVIDVVNATSASIEVMDRNTISKDKLLANYSLQLDVFHDETRHEMQLTLNDPTGAGRPVGVLDIIAEYYSADRACTVMVSPVFPDTKDEDITAVIGVFQRRYQITTSTANEALFHVESFEKVGELCGKTGLSLGGRALTVSRAARSIDTQAALDEAHAAGQVDANGKPKSAGAKIAGGLKDVGAGIKDGFSAGLGALKSKMGKK